VTCVASPIVSASDGALGTKWDLYAERLSLAAAMFDMEKTNSARASRTAIRSCWTASRRCAERSSALRAASRQPGRCSRALVYLDSEYEQSANTLEVGQELLLTPDFTFNAWTTYALPLGLTIGAGVQYIDDIVRTRTAALGEVTVPGYWLFDAMASVQFADTISVRLNAMNLADEEYVDRFGGGHYVPGAGRAISLTANFAF
jgi:catecholate siderophore receptor